MTVKVSRNYSTKSLSENTSQNTNGFQVKNKPAQPENQLNKTKRRKAAKGFQKGDLGRNLSGPSNTSHVSGSPVGNALNIAALHTNRSSVFNSENVIKVRFSAIKVQNQIQDLPSEKQHRKQSNMPGNVHFGLQFNANFPFKGYDAYFTGTNGRNQFYAPFIPGICVGKMWKNGNQLLIKVNPYHQHFGNNKQLDSSSVKRIDSTNVKNIRLIKSSGFNLGLQFNYKLYKGWSAGLGVNGQWQHRALVRATKFGSRDSLPADQAPPFDVKQSFGAGQNLSNSFVTTNFELLYAWRKFQISAGVILHLFFCPPSL